jgi:capsule polysaccharide modification protein KpsS
VHQSEHSAPNGFWFVLFALQICSSEKFRWLILFSQSSTFLLTCAENLSNRKQYACAFIVYDHPLYRPIFYLGFRIIKDRSDAKKWGILPTMNKKFRISWLNWFLLVSL